MTFAAKEGTSTTTPAAIELPSSPDSTRLGVSFLFTNTGSVTLWCGGEDIQVGQRWPLLAGATVPMPLNGPDTLWAYTESGSTTWAWLRNDD
jgi:hypothetical protein